MKWMKETLDSVTASDMPSTVVVVDNKPTDGTVGRGGDATLTVNQWAGIDEGKISIMVLREALYAFRRSPRHNRFQTCPSQTLQEIGLCLLRIAYNSRDSGNNMTL
jgi:hypothetical protein